MTTNVAPVPSNSGKGYVSAAQAQMILSAKTRKLMGFSRRSIPDLEALRRVKFYMFNVGFQEHVWRQPGFPTIVIPKREENEEYSGPVAIMEMYPEEYLGTGDTTELNWYNGIEIVYSVLQTGPGMPTSLDLRKRGVFFSEHNPPLAEEVSEARDLLTGTCSKLVMEAQAAFAKNEVKDINEDNRAAAKFLGVSADWNKKHVPMIECPACAQPVASTAGVHYGPGGCGGVVNWDIAIATGLKKESDRPELVAKEHSHSRPAK